MSLTKPDAEEFSQSLEQIGEGWFRQLALGIKLGVPEALGLTRREWSDRIGLKVRDKVERRKVGIELASEGLSNRAIADVLGVGSRTVDRDLSAPNGAQDGEGKDGNAPNGAPLTLVEATVSARKAAVPRLREQGLSNRQIAAEVGCSEATVRNDLAAQNCADSAQNCAPQTRALLSQSDQNDWRTPRKYLDAAREVMGAIDLDPASSAEANETVLARKFYTKEENGLQLPWKGTVWLNPPYGGDARLFIDRLLKEYQVGNVTAACALVNSHPTETKWFQQLFDYPVCFINGRIDFGGPSRKVSSTSTHGSAVVFLGSEVGKFKDEFSKFGAVVGKL